MTEIKITAANVEMLGDGRVVIRNSDFTDLAKSNPKAAADIVSVDVNELKVDADGAVEISNPNASDVVMDVNIWCDSGC